MRHDQPRNEIPPTKDTLAPAKINTTPMPASRTAHTFTPSPAALSSPRTSTDNLPERSWLISPAPAIHGIVRRRLCHVMPDKLPAVQNDSDFESPKVIDIPWLNAVNRAETALPAKMSRIDPDLCLPIPIPYTRSTASAAPINAKIIVPKLDKDGKRTAVRAMKNPAPALTPKSPASAKGFLVTPCITPPARARAAPVTQAANALGIRISSIILPMPADAAGWKSVSNKILIFPPATPTLTEIRSESNNATPIKTRDNA